MALDQVAPAATSPRVVIAARAVLIDRLKTIGGSRMTDAGAAEIADWLISSGNLADSFYETVAADLVAADTPADS